ncbi:CDPalcohol phosphatidyltransferase superfamily protein [Acanthamoeba castellanii str. Neff]|uniref:CDPalcohol phosphatidyltransferase superfamily protein n=1 Tax=Acanthamoeba castellanii (strain ATCC 30010 / Neff) TaxID=1257118 RepID=L8H630_ACACF|nr:CDPalcohol phosphatidyltransferase superfamily protein [Acanthamoeba castellanii str. Neff]ELR20677.1 CDPalcohol phosphatidyltransferase superfamily protein [Acanthamoeba castellanii str. Neff]
MSKRAEASAWEKLFRYVDEKDLPNLKLYAYHGVDRSIIANHVGQPFWRWVVEFLPLTMAANLVTVVGFAFMVASYALTAFYVPSLTGEAPWWVYMVNALCLFIYQTMDAARRTNTSSPLGELVDHGCDALTTTLMALTVASSLQLGPTWVAQYAIIMSMAGFYAAQWEEYHTGVLDLGIFNVTEAQLSTMGLYVATALLGPSVWLQTITVFGYTVQCNHLFIALATFPMLQNIFSSVYNMAKRVGEGADGLVAVFGRLFPFLSLVAASVVWANYSKADVLQHPQLWIGSFGLLCGNIIGRMVLARVVKQAFHPIQPLLFSFYIGAALSLVGAWSARVEYAFLVGCYVQSILGYYLFAHSVVHEITTYLDIGFLTIKNKRSKKAN